MQIRNTLLPMITCVIMGFSIMLLVGCGGSSDFKTASVNGKITCNGQPVTQGRLIFTPQAPGDQPAGKSALGEIQSDGTFQLSTYSRNDGAVIGTHKVRLKPPVQENEDEEQPEIKFDCKIPADYTVEIQKGTNDITIALEAKE